MYSPQLLPDSYLDQLIQRKHPVCIYLRNGGRLNGVLVKHSKEILIIRESITDIVSKRLVSMIVRQFSKS